MSPFNYTSTFDLNIIKSRTFSPSSVDHAVQWNGKYFDPQDMQNLYVEIEDQVYENDKSIFRDVHRFVADEALLISPMMSSAICPVEPMDGPPTFAGKRRRGAPVMRKMAVARCSRRLKAPK